MIERIVKSHEELTGVSLQLPEYTANVDGLGVLRILESIRNFRLKDKCKFYQASTSELYGKVQHKIQI